MPDSIRSILAGDPMTGIAAEQLLPLVYSELRRLAAVRLARAAPGATLQPTALVHEAYLGLVANGDPGWNGRAHFFGAAARAMHDIVVDRARRRAAQKRGGGAKHEDVAAISIAAPGSDRVDDVLALSAVMARLAVEHPRRHEVAMLRTFAGLTEEEIAELHGVSTRTIEREWRFARAWLARELGS
ncbi:MAG: sigma-70 family RNA polymerase sigma factor [Labilithrix sp.]|nr:sigma-70 family RNA polymerase sigma factor [Labilithrix sp.]MCW5813178.1 sigma-70 family RNA polymerase sigma factor [Labilithrix sp.]